MEGDQKKELMGIVDRLPPTKIIELLEVAKHLQVPPENKEDLKDREEAFRCIRGKYKDVLSSSDEFAARKADERRLEDR